MLAHVDSVSTAEVLTAWGFAGALVGGFIAYITVRARRRS